jgi:hypothetical protein
MNDEQNVEDLNEQDQSELDVFDRARAQGFKLTPAQRRRNRKYQQEFRARQKEKLRAAGFASPADEQLKTQWQQNRAAIMADPEKCVALQERLFDFQFIRKQMTAVVDRVRHGVHPDVEAAGRFYDCVAEDVLDTVKKYGLVECFPAEILHLAVPTEIESMKMDSRFHHRMALGLDVDGLSNLEYLYFFEYFFEWYLKNRDNPTYDYDWDITDSICHSFEIPEKFLTGIFARPTSIWTRLHSRRISLDWGATIR